MSKTSSSIRYRFAEFELDPAVGELRRGGVRVRLHVQPLEVLAMLAARPGELLSREEIVLRLWPEGTFVDYEHGLNSAVNRLREALGDKASQPRFVETIARKGYRFIAPVERVETAIPSTAPQAGAISGNERTGFLDRVLASPADLPRSSPMLAWTLFSTLQCMYMSFYIGTLANLGEIADLMSPIPAAAAVVHVVTICAAVLIPVRLFLICAVLFRAPGFRGRFLRLWPWLAVVDLAWSLAPLLLLNHISFGLALACTAPLVYAPFAQRSLVLMGAATVDAPA